MLKKLSIHDIVMVSNSFPSFFPFTLGFSLSLLISFHSRNDKNIHMNYVFLPNPTSSTITLAPTNNSSPTMKTVPPLPYTSDTNIEDNQSFCMGQSWIISMYIKPTIDCAKSNLTLSFMTTSHFEGHFSVVRAHQLSIAPKRKLARLRE